MFYPKRVAKLYTLIFLLIWLLLGATAFLLFKEIFSIYKTSYIFFSYTLILLLGSFLTYIFSYQITLLLFTPINDVIEKVNEINIYKEVDLLEEPKQEGELKDLIIAFNHMLLRIKEQYEYQNAFFSSASHELRTPLAVMLTQLQILAQNNQSEELRQVYTGQIKEVKRLIQMVNDFLLMGEINNQKIQLSNDECNLSDIVTDLISNYKNKMQERNISFKISYNPVEEDYSILTDEDKFKIILGNLIHNAVKYSQNNSSIELSLTKKDEKIIINISNIIREDIHPQLTDIKNKFYHSKPLHGEGSGLGLWICKQLADLQDFELFFTIKDQTFFEASLIV